MRIFHFDLTMPIQIEDNQFTRRLMMFTNRLYLILLVLFISLSSFAEKPSVKILKLVGGAQFDGVKLKVGDLISKNGKLEVSDDAKASLDLIYSSGHKIRLKSGAQLLLSGENEKFAKQLTLLKGKSYMHFQKKPDVFEFQIKTKTAVAGVRGTKFLIEDLEGATYLCVCEGVVELVREKEVRRVSAGQDLWSRPGKVLGAPIDSPGMSKMTMDEFESM